MKRVSLQWYRSYSISELYEILKQSVSVSDKKYPSLNNYGFYMYLDQNLTKVLYIGQAYDRSPRSLRNRIRWEIVKDGTNGTWSTFSKDCANYKMNKFSLKLKVAHITKATYKEDRIVPDQKLMNDVEMALIHEMKPCMNKSGKQRYRRESIEIMNQGNFAPLPKKIKKYQFARTF